jgi:hypothetical protein
MNRKLPLLNLLLILLILACISFWVGFVTYVVPVQISKFEYSDKISIGRPVGLSDQSFDLIHLGNA